MSSPHLPILVSFQSRILLPRIVPSSILGLLTAASFYSHLLCRRLLLNERKKIRMTSSFFWRRDSNTNTNFSRFGEHMSKVNIACTAALLHCCTNALLHCCTDTQMHGYTATRLHGCMAAWQHGCMAAQLHGCTDTQMHGYHRDRSIHIERAC